MLGLGDMYVHLCAIRPTLPRNAECGLFFDYIWLAHPHPAHCGRFFDYIWLAHPHPAHCGRFFDYIWLAHLHPAHCGRFFDYNAPVSHRDEKCVRFFAYIRPYAALLAPASKNAPADVGDMAEASLKSVESARQLHSGLRSLAF
ncbi:hypothetical protein BK146_20740 [Paenibacillus sp. FSL R7-0333]|nr:hypothetical protein BK146_20740 [Paenibacillus sp. FSL R7-0333]